MILLSTTTDKLQVISGQAVTLDVHCSYMDMTTADPPVVKGSTSAKQNTAITTATTTDVVAAPAASTIRNVKTINIRNKHATSSCDVTVQFNQNATLFELHKRTLRPGEVLEYVEGVGWVVPSPSLKILGQSSPSVTTLTDIYTVPSGVLSSVVEMITVCNRSSTPTTFRISLAVGGAADNVKQYIAYDCDLQANENYTWSDLQAPLATTDVLRGYVGAATVSFNVFGIELT